MFFYRLYLFTFRQGKGGRKRGRTSVCERYIYPLPLTPDRGPGAQTRHVPDWESNWQPPGLQASAQATEPHQPGLYFLKSCIIFTSYT